MALNNFCSPDLSNDRRQNDVAGNRKINNDGVGLTPSIGQIAFYSRAPQQAALPSRFVARYGARNRSPSFDLCNSFDLGGADRDRTGDFLLAKQALSQLSYSP